ncbi:MAG: hypothetical protein WBK08_18825, partial [Nitrospira sp.]
WKSMRNCAIIHPLHLELETAMSLICMASPSILSSCFQPLGQPCKWDSATETCWRRAGIHLLLMTYVIIFSMSVRIKGVGSIYIDD